MGTKLQQQTGDKLIRILIFTMVISAMSATMFNIVLPSIKEEFNLSYAQVSWVSSAYMLIYAVGSVIYGKLADIYKLNNLITCGLILFVLGSLFGLASYTYWMVLLGRILQAMGASVIPATAMIIPIRFFPKEKRGRTLGSVAAGLALGFALGPVAAALLLSVAGWQWLFFIPFLTLFTIPLYRKYLVSEQSKTGNIDWLGGGLLIGTVVMLLMAVMNETWLLGLGGIVLLRLFLVRIRSTKEPFIQPGLFSNKRYSLGLTISFLASGLGYSLPFLSPLVLAEVHQLAPGLIGLTMVPAALIAALLGRVGGKLADSKGNSVLFYLATTLLLTCFSLLSALTGSAPIYIGFMLIFGQVGQMYMNVAMSNSIAQTLPKEQSGVGMGLLALVNFIGASFAAGVYSKMVDVGARIHWNPTNMYPETSIYSNIYLVIALLYVCLFIFFKLSARQQNSLSK